MTRTIQQSLLAIQLKEFRKASKISQTQLAAQSGVALATVRLAETTGGKLSTFMLLLEELNQTIKGQSLPAGEFLGASLKTLRIRHRLSLRNLGEKAQVSVPTLLAIEAGEDCYLINLEKISKVLDARLFLHEKDKPLSFYHGGLSNSSNFTGWTTPEWILERLYPIVGGQFDLDPCSPTSNAKKATVRAYKYYTGDDEQDCGLANDWDGAVFVNPPYGKQLIKWVKKCDLEFNSGRAKLIIGLLPLRSDVLYWQQYIANKTSILFFQGRLQFGGLGENCGRAPFSSVLCIWCDDVQILNQIEAAFPEHWFVLAQRFSR